MESDPLPVFCLFLIKQVLDNLVIISIIRLSFLDTEMQNS